MPRMTVQRLGERVDTYYEKNCRRQITERAVWDEKLTI